MSHFQSSSCFSRVVSNPKICLYPLYAQDPHSMAGKTSSVDTFYISVDTISVSCHQVAQAVTNHEFV